MLLGCAVPPLRNEPARRCFSLGKATHNAPHNGCHIPSPHTGWRPSRIATQPGIVDGFWALCRSSFHAGEPGLCSLTSGAACGQTAAKALLLA